MTLAQSKLEAEFAKIMNPDDPGFVGFPLIDDGLGGVDILASRQASAQNWATAYNTYALDAVDASGDTFLAPPDPGNFANALSFATMDPASLAAEFGVAFIAYWTGVTFAIGALLNPATEPCASVGGTGIWSVEQISAVSLVTSIGLIASLASELAINSEDGAAKAASIAGFFHTATTTEVAVLITGLDTTSPPSGPLPITNFCQIF